jgi:hypothetical protein
LVARSDDTLAGSGTAPGMGRTDLVVCLALALAAFALYAGFGLRLAAGRFLEFYNLAFDFDPPPYLALLTGEEFERGNVKHPLVLLLRPLAWVPTALGVPPQVAATLLMAVFGGATVAVAYLFLRTLAAAVAPAAALAVLFAVSGAQVFTSIIVEAYGPAAFGIAGIWLLAARGMADPARGGHARLAAAVFAYGVTTTNVVQSFIAEALLWWRRRGLAGALRPMVRFGLAVAAVAALLTAIVWIDWLVAALADPVELVRQVYWARTKGERVGAADTVLRLLGYTFVSPKFDRLPVPEGYDMVDFRTPAFGPLAGTAWVAWHLFWATGAVAALAHPRTRWLATAMAGTLAFNIVLHLDFQFRGSLYLYAGHTHFLMFALGAGLAPLLHPGSRAAAAYVAVVLVLTVLVGAVTFDRAADFATRFDEVIVNLPSPVPGAATP